MIYWCRLCKYFSSCPLHVAIIKFSLNAVPIVFFLLYCMCPRLIACCDDYWGAFETPLFPEDPCLAINKE